MIESLLSFVTLRSLAPYTKRALTTKSAKGNKGFPY